MKAILVPSDFSKNAKTALRYAIRLSRLMKCQLVVFHCTHQTPFTLIDAENEDDMDKLIRMDEEEKTRKLKKVVESSYKYLGYPKTPPQTKVFAQFNPVFIEKTIAVARKYDAGLIVMGTHGATGIGKRLFGSNTSIMISKSDIPVMAVPENFKYRNIENIVFASDLENFSAELNRIVPFARPLNAMITVLHIDYGIDPEGKITKKVESDIKRNAYKKITLVRQEATSQPLLKQVRHFLEEYQQQWLVMFTKERSFWDRIIMGSKTEEFSMTLTLPLLSFKKVTSEA